MALTKQLARRLANPEPVLLKNIPHLDEDVWIQPMSGKERLDFMIPNSDEPEKSGVLEMFEMVACCVVDETGNRIYEDDELGDLAALNLKSVRHIAEELSSMMGLNLEESEEN